MQVIATVISIIGIQLLAHKVNTLTRYGAEKTGDEIYLAALSGKKFKCFLIATIFVGIIWFGNLMFYFKLVLPKGWWFAGANSYRWLQFFINLIMILL